MIWRRCWHRRERRTATGRRRHLWEQIRVDRQVSVRFLIVTERMRGASYWDLRRRAMTSVMSHAFLMFAMRITTTAVARRSGAHVELTKSSTAAARAPTYARVGETPYASQSIQ